ncbi:lamin tail domain-containing protein [Candidatus Azambacteria bacterium]|nr:lamin tail domain-containing protein [Candidatus Azambacteria bacterium]
MVKKQYFDIAALFTTLFSGGLLTFLIKTITKRPRPEWPFPVYYEPSFSFPSFHATGAVLLYGFIIYLVWQNSSSRKIRRFSFVLSIFIILVIGFSRLYLGVHYFSDVVAGYILGILCLIGGIYIIKHKIVRGHSSNYLPLGLIILLFIPFLTFAGNSGEVVFNEIAWMGTKANSSDEWLELYNNTANEIDLTGWKIYGEGGKTLIISLKKRISPLGYYLIERTDDNSIKDILADDYGSFGGNGLSNKGEYLVLKDNLGHIINQIDFSAGWPAGSASPDYQSMERGANGSWQSNNGVTKNGIDAKGNLIMGTPRSLNSSYQVSISAKVSDLTKQVEPVSQVQPVVNTSTPVQPVIVPSQPIIPVPAQVLVQDSPVLSSVTIPPQSMINNPTQTSIPVQLPAISPTLTLENDLKNLFISEIMPNPNGADKNNEWIEIYNGSDNLIDLSLFYLINGSGKIFTIPNGEKLASKGFLLLSSSRTKISLNNRKDNLKLFTPKLQGNLLLSEVSYLNIKEGSSLVRNSLGQYEETKIPTPGLANIFEKEKINKHDSSNNKFNKKDHRKLDNENLTPPISYSDNKKLPQTVIVKDYNQNNLSSPKSLAKLPLDLPLVMSIVGVLSTISLVIIFFLKSKII